jgi:hypothetical protein
MNYYSFLRRSKSICLVFACGNTQVYAAISNAHLVQQTTCYNAGLVTANTAPFGQSCLVTCLTTCRKYPGSKPFTDKIISSTDTEDVYVTSFCSNRCFRTCFVHAAFRASITPNEVGVYKNWDHDEFCIVHKKEIKIKTDTAEFFCHISRVTDRNMFICVAPDVSSLESNVHYPLISFLSQCSLPQKFSS